MPDRRLGACQEALYAAEGQAIDGLGRRWSRLSQAQAYLDELVSSAWFFDRWPSFVRCVVERRGSGSVWSTCHHLDANGPGGTATEGVILVCDGGLTQPVLLHELAHLLVPRHVGHGAAFAETHLALVRHEMGFFAFAAYRHALRQETAFVDVQGEVDPPPATPLHALAP